jgi:hypothetical protein
MVATTIIPPIVDVINKPVLDKMIISICGHDATKDDVYKTGLRRLLQLAISVIENETETTLENSEFSFYDFKDDRFTILSGYGQNVFTFIFNGLLEPSILIDRVRVQRRCECIQSVFDWINPYNLIE